MTEYTDKTGATVTVQRDPAQEAYLIRDATGEVAGHAAFRLPTPEDRAWLDGKF